MFAHVVMENDAFADAGIALVEGRLCARGGGLRLRNASAEGGPAAVSTRCWRRVRRNRLGKWSSRLVLRLRCIDGSTSGSVGSPPYSDSRRHAAIRFPRLHGSRGIGASASFCASFLVPNSGDFFPRRHFACSPLVRRSAGGCIGKVRRAPATPAGIRPLPGCAAWTGLQGSTRPGRCAAGRAFPITARSHAGDAPARCKRTPRFHAPLP